MEKKILIAVDASRQTLETIDYAARVNETIAPASYTLVHIEPPLSQYLTDEAQRKQSAQIALEKVMAQNQAKARETQATASQRLVTGGVDKDRIRRLSLPRNKSVADDLLALTMAKSYDAILVGRHGSSYMRQWLMGSVTANLIEHAEMIPIWVVDGTVASNDILLAADGSQSTLRALDHIAFMLSDQPSRQIHLLHVRPRLQDYCEIKVPDDTLRAAETVLLDEDRHCMDDFYAQALTALAKNNVPKERMEMVTLDGKLSVTRSVLGYAREHGFGTVVMGRRGRSKSTFFGSSSRGILQKAEDMALWVVP